MDEKSRERKKNKEYITRRIDPPPPPPSGRYRFTDSCNFYTLERRGHDAHKRLKHVRAFIDRSTSSLPPSSFHASGTHRAERWFMGFHNTCNIWQTLLATLFMPRMGHHHPLSLRWWKSGKTAWWKEGEEKKKGKKKTREIRSVTSPRLASKIRVAQFRPLDRFETNRGEKNSTVKMHNKCETKLTPLTKGFIET